MAGQAVISSARKRLSPASHGVSFQHALAVKLGYSLDLFARHFKILTRIGLDVQGFKVAGFSGTAPVPDFSR